MTSLVRISLAAFLALTLAGSNALASSPADNTADKADSLTAQGLIHDSKCSVMKEQFIELTALQATEQWFWRQERKRHPRSRYYHFEDADLGGEMVQDAPAAQPAPTSSSARSSSGTAASSEPQSYTTTNVQEAGVDEADIVKTDGKYIYTLTGEEIVIIKSWPADEAKVLSRMKIGDGARPTNLFLNGDKLVAISYLNHGAQIGAETNRRSWYGATRLSVIDVRNRANPHVVRHVDIEGRSNEARMIGNDVYVVTNSNLHAPTELSLVAQKFDNWPEFDQKSDVDTQKRKAFARIKSYLDSKLAAADFKLSLPHKRVSAYRGKFGTRPFEPLTECSDVHVPKNGVQHGMVSLVHFDVRTPWNVNGSSVFGQGWKVYGSEEAIYVAMPNHSWVSWYRWYTGGEPDYKELNSTNIHKFELRRDVGKPTYAASGRVRGFLLNQFSMSEYNGDLRVATTDNGRSAPGEQPQQGNHIYVLRPDGNSLATIGRVEGLAPGERVFAARMFGDKGYIVTFRQTDPLFTLDLSDPTQPEVAGELKINGFSNYIHPLGNGQLLTVGQDADENGRVKGVHLQIFDVTDPSEPTRTHHHTFETLGYSYSAAQTDHRAFTYEARTGTLAIPMQIFPTGGKTPPFNGIFIFGVDAKDGFTDRGRVTHDLLIESWQTRFCDKNPATYNCRENRHHAWHNLARLQRSIIMDDTIFTFSTLGLMAHKMASPDRPLAAIELAKM